MTTRIPARSNGTRITADHSNGTRITADHRGSFPARRGPTRTQQIGLLVVLALLAALAVARVIAG